MRYAMTVCLVLSLAACGGDTPSETKATSEPSKPDVGAPEKPAAPTEPTIYVKIDANGTANMSKLDQPDELAATANLAADGLDAHQAAIDALRKAAAEAVQGARVVRNEKGAPNVVLALSVDGTTRWQYVQWTVQIFAEPGVEIGTIDLADPRGGPPLRITLPMDGGLEEEVEELLEEGEEPPPARAGPNEVTVKAFRRGLQGPAEERYTLFKLNGEAFALPKGPEANQDDAYWTQMRALRDKLSALVKTSARVEPDKPLRFEFSTPPPKGGSVPYFDAFRVLRMARDLGIEHIQMEGKALPLGRR